MKKTRILMVLALLAGTALTSPAWGMKRIPTFLRHHGRLLHSDGSPASGVHTMTLSLWTDPVVGSKVKEVIRSVPVSSEGLYTVEWGGDTSLTVDDLVDPGGVPGDAELWLEIDVDGLGPVSPRIRLESSPYAVGAHRVAGDFFTEHNELTMFEDTSGEPLMKFKAGKALKESVQYYEEPLGGGPAELSTEVFTTGGMATGRRQHMPIKFTGAVLPSNTPGYEIITDTAGTHGMAAKNSMTGHSSWMQWSATDLGAEQALHDEEGLTSNRLQLGTTAGHGSELSLSTTGPGTQSAKIVTHTPEWTNLNSADPGITMVEVDAGGDSAITTAATAHLYIKSNGTNSDNDMDFDVRGDTARVEMTSSPGGSGGGGRVAIEYTADGGPMSELRVANLGINGEDGVTVHSSNGRKTIRAHDFATGGDTAGAWDLTIDTSGSQLSIKEGGLNSSIHTSSDGGSMSLYHHTDPLPSRRSPGVDASSHDAGEFWFTDLVPGLSVSQSMMIGRTTPDSAKLDIMIDTSGTSLAMNKADLVNALANTGSSASMSILDVGSSGQDGFVMQHNQTDLDFTMRSTDAGGTDSSFVTMHTDSGLADLRLHQESTSGHEEIHIKPNRIEMTDAQISPSQTKVLVMAPTAVELTQTVLSVPETVYKVDAHGTSTGTSLRVRYPSGTGGASEVFLGDLDGDAIPDLSVAGRVGIGTTSPTEALHVVGNACATGGHITCSDERFKDDIRDIDDPVARLEQLRGVEFEWRRDEFEGYQFASGRQVGFIAQEVRDVLPEVVSEGADGYLAMDYSRLTPLLVEAVKAQQERIDKLEALLELLIAEKAATQ